jgi:L-galactose dehydrogenase
MEYRTLGNTGLKVAPLGFGAAPLGDEYGKLDAAEATRAVHMAIDRGINLFDVAPYYGRTLAETRLGEALRGRRDKVVLATKCARYDKAAFDFSATRVTRSVDESLARLQTDYLDIFLVHDIEFGDRTQIVNETIPAMRRIQQSGKARFIGITGLPVDMLCDVAIAAPVDCVLSYCRYNLINTELQDRLLPYCKEQGIGLINASPLHMGMLTEDGPPEWHPGLPEIRATAHKIIDFCRSQALSVPSIALQFALINPDITSTLNGMSTQEQVEQNLAALERPIDQHALEEIEEIARPTRKRMWPSGLPENHDASMR